MVVRQVAMSHGCHVRSCPVSTEALGGLPLSPSVYAMIADQHGRVRGRVGPGWTVSKLQNINRWKTAEMAHCGTRI